MKSSKFKEIEKIRFNKNFDKLHVEVIEKEKFATLRNKKNKSFIIWKYFVIDHTGIIELISHHDFDFTIRSKITISKFQQFFFRGKIRLLGAFSYKTKNFNLRKETSHDQIKNYSKIVFNRIFQS